MFKRIQKKQKRAELDEELGLDEDTKLALGLGNADTDTDESESESESESDSDSASGSDVVGLDGEDIASEEEELDADVLDVEEDGSDDGSEDALDDVSPLTLEQALRNPIYSIDHDHQVRCIVCPRKKLKTGGMQETHLASAPHIRRFKTFCDLAQKPKHSSKDPRILVSVLDDSPDGASAVHGGGMSRREEKRRKKLEIIKKKRETTKRIIERKKKQKDAKDQPRSQSPSVSSVKLKGQEDKTTPSAVSPMSAKSTKNPKTNTTAKKAKASSSDSADSKSGKLHTRKGTEDAQVGSSHAELPVEAPKTSKSKKSKAEPKAESSIVKQDTDASTLATSKPKAKGTAQRPSPGQPSNVSGKHAAETEAKPRQRKRKHEHGHESSGQEGEVDDNIKGDARMKAVATQQSAKGDKSNDDRRGRPEVSKSKKRKTDSNPTESQKGNNNASKIKSKSEVANVKKSKQRPPANHTSNPPPKRTRGPVLRYFDNSSNVGTLSKKEKKGEQKAKDLVIFD